VFSGSIMLWLFLSVWLQSFRKAPVIQRVAGRAFVSMGIVILLIAFIR
jgi:hypothetical protein